MEIETTDLGFIDVKEALEAQNSALAEAASGRSGGRILLAEHPAVITIGRAGVVRRFPAGDPRRHPAVLDPGDIPVVELERGGDAVYHGPGQLLFYPVLPLRRLGIGLVEYLTALERSALNELLSLGVEARLRSGLRGVWVGRSKIAFIGVAARRWITLHGMALNVRCDLAPFKKLRPCGLEGVSATSILAELGRAPELSEMGTRLAGRLQATLAPAATNRLTTGAGVA